MDLSEKTELTWLADLIADVREAARTYEPLVVGAIGRLRLLSGAGAPTIDAGLVHRRTPDEAGVETVFGRRLCSSPEHQLSTVLSS